MDDVFHPDPGLLSGLKVGTVGTDCVLVCMLWFDLVDDGFNTNPGLDGEFYRFYSILAKVGTVGTLCVLVCMLGVDHVWWMTAFTPIQAWMPSLTDFFDFSLGWQGWHSLCFGLHVVGLTRIDILCQKKRPSVVRPPTNPTQLDSD